MREQLDISGRKWVIYALLDPETKATRYIGVTFRGERTRLREHLCRARTGGRSHRDCWIASLLQRKREPIMAVVERGVGSGWQEAERRWIAEARHSGAQLVNLTDGGDGTPGLLPTAEMRAKWSATRKGRTYKHIRPGGMTGRRHSPEAVNKIRAALFGRPHSPETRAKLAAAHKGKTLTPEHCAKIGDLKRGRKLSDAHKSKIAASTKGRVQVLCVETGETHASVTAVARLLGVSESSIAQAIRKGCRSGGLHWRRA